MHLRQTGNSVKRVQTYLLERPFPRRQDGGYCFRRAGRGAGGIRTLQIEDPQQPDYHHKQGKGKDCACNILLILQYFLNIHGI